jgi:nanoRNase/pAp phosphatase (c-di-AMP/oligoRNAs hydrolase)
MGLWQDISSLLTERDVKSILVSCHRNADPDAISSAYGLKKLIQEWCPHIEQVEIVVDGFNEVCKRVMSAYPEITVKNDIISEPDVFILVDVNNIGHVGKLGEHIGKSSRPVVIIDHHVSQGPHRQNTNIIFTDEEASSTSEIICSLYESLGKNPSQKVATIMLIGIIYDSKRFSIVGKGTFRAASYLVDAGADYQNALSVLRHPIGRSEKIARLKAAQRSRIVEIDGWIISLSEVSSFGASACRGLMDLGADAAIVSSDKKKLKRVSARSTSRFCKNTGVNLAKVMEKVGVELGGSGGGHATAATVSGMEDARKAEKLVLRYIHEMIRETKE